MADKNKPSADFSTRYDTAKRWRDAEKSDLQEIYSYTAPGREKDFDTKTLDGPRTYDDDDPEVFMSLPEELATDFAADLVTYFTPKEAKWTEYNVTMPVPIEAVKAVEDIVTAREDELYDMIQASNYNDVAAQVLFEANHGTPAMWVDQAHLTMPFYVETVPANELLITPGHLGILDRFRETQVSAQSLKALFSSWEEVDLSDEKIQRKIKKPGQICDVCWGFWLDWEDPGNPLWRCEITVDTIRVTPPKPLTLGPYAGSCPLLVGRFNPRVKRPWGRGPARVAMRDMRVYNAVSEAVLDGLDQSLKNTLIYADDGFLDFSEGLEPGRAYPASRGFTRDQVYEMNRGANLDTGFYSEDRLEERLRSCFYQDGPRQRGDTPPTASQWIDERRRVQQRLGKPSAPLWTEFFLPFIQRVERIAIDKGRMEAELTHNGNAITISPMSPLQKAQNQDKVMVARSNLDLGAGAFQENFAAVVDLTATFRNIVDASGDELTVIKDQEEQQEPTAGAPPVQDQAQ